MYPPGDPLAHPWETVLIALLAMQLVTMPYHDWIPLGRLNNVHNLKQAAERASFRDAVLVTLLQTLPLAVCLIFCLAHFGAHYPYWLEDLLWGFFSVMFVLEIRAFWIPYLVREDKVRAARYREEFAHTHAFLPVRHGMVPNTLHVFVHAGVAATLVVLYFSGH